MICLRRLRNERYIVCHVPGGLRRSYRHVGLVAKFISLFRIPRSQSQVCGSPDSIYRQSAILLVDPRTAIPIRSVPEIQAHIRHRRSDLEHSVAMHNRSCDAYALSIYTTWAKKRAHFNC